MPSSKTITDRLEIPNATQAILWDLDGTLIDSLSLDCTLCSKLIKEFVSPDASVSRDFIRSIFAYEVPVFWRMILEKIRDEFDIPDALDAYDQILPLYNTARQSEPFPLNPGIRELVDEINNSDQLTQAVVSNNPTQDVLELLENSGLIDDFELIVGNDIEVEGKKLAKKPAPDTFLYAAEQLGVSPENCVVIEDSVLGVTGGKAAGMYTVAIATGSADFEDLQKAGADQIYNSFAS